MVHKAKMRGECNAALTEIDAKSGSRWGGGGGGAGGGVDDSSSSVFFTLSMVNACAVVLLS
jgi:hypothetical protein